MNDKWYHSLFELAKKLYNDNVYAYNFDLPFEETLKRHKTKPNCQEFGEEAMRGWWIEKDYSEILDECSITQEKDFDSIVVEIYSKVISG